MAVPASGAFRASAIRDTFGGPQSFRLGSYRRSPSGPYVYANAANNPATNLAAAVTLSGVPLRLNCFRSQLPGWTYTNLTVRLNNFYVSTAFGDNWWTNWPKTFTNNNAIGATSTGYYACIIHAGAGRVDFVNNSEIQGGGGEPNSNPGQIALLITALTCTLFVTNNGGIRGGGGAGGAGGQGGTGGTGYYTYTAQEGPVYAPASYEIRTSPGATKVEIFWGGASIYRAGSGGPPITLGVYTYHAGARMDAGGSTAHYQVLRQWPVTVYTAGAAGGAGGNGGRGIGYGNANQVGSPGAPGGNAGGNSGVGGTGGTGGTGGSWGEYGFYGNTGSPGATGNWAGGTGGAGGGPGGAGGYSIYADSAWFVLAWGTINGPVGPRAPG